MPLLDIEIMDYEEGTNAAVLMSEPLKSEVKPRQLAREAEIKILVEKEKHEAVL